MPKEKKDNEVQDLSVTITCLKILPETEKFTHQYI